LWQPGLWSAGSLLGLSKNVMRSPDLAYAPVAARPRSVTGPSVNVGSLQSVHAARRGRVKISSMLSFEEALTRVLDAARRLETETVELGDAAGRVLAEDLTAEQPLPPFDYSAMDGYAVASRDLSGAGPWTLPVRGESRTGRPPARLEPGSACRIFTGAELPSGADSVVLQEDVQRSGTEVLLNQKAHAGDNVRRRGEDLERGQSALSSGQRVSAAQIGLAAALNRARLTVARRPRVSIACTGDELRPAGTAERPGSIPNSNGPALAAAVRAAGGVARELEPIGDDRERTTLALRAGLKDADLLVTVGGVSVGDHDVVRPALEAAGVNLEFWKVRLKPGKPLVFGRAGATLVLGVPGNPVSALLTFLLFGVPLLRAMQGDRQPLPPQRRGRLLEPLRQKPGRRGYYRARTEGADRLRPLDNQASGAPTSLAWADALAIVPEDSSGFDANEWVDYLLLAEM
jgi:molybdopterin molybdotransferase